MVVVTLRVVGVPTLFTRLMFVTSRQNICFFSVNEYFLAYLYVRFCSILTFEQINRGSRVTQFTDNREFTVLEDDMYLVKALA